MEPKPLISFTRVEQSYPPKRAAHARITDFREIQQHWALDDAQLQSSRCSQCGVPFCQVHCPLQNNIPDWLKLAAEGRLREAWELSATTSTMPEVCGRICPQDRLCEGGCVIEQSGHGAVTIGAVETFLTETAFAQGWVAPIRPIRPPTGRSVGIIGAGPAGLTVAELLAIQGHAVTLYDRHDRAGGLLIYGIPGFKLDKEVVARRVARLAEAGIRFRLETEIGSDLPFAEVRAAHDALMLATGVYRPRPLDVPGGDLPGVVKALDYLIASNRRGLGDTVPRFESGELDAAGRDVVVVGGGDTAMDCVRTAVRQGARSVTCLYRRDRANMPGSAREVAHAEEEGVRFEWLAAPLAFHGRDGRVARVSATRMRLGPPDASGRRRPEPQSDEPVDLPASLVIEALGFEAEDLPGAFGQPDLPVTRWGTVRTDPLTLETGLRGVFAGGDIVRGASLVVWAMRDGRDAARAIHAWLAANPAAAKRKAA